MERKKVIAFCGTRGLPANYGGFETAVDEITKRFVKYGHEVHVFTRNSNTQQKHNEYEGRKVIYVKGSVNRKLDTFVSSIQTAFYLLRNRKKYDYIFWFNNANFPGIFLTFFTGVQFSVNTDGLEWRRGKWSLPFKAYYFISSFLISLFSKSLISDSISIQEYYRKTFLKKTNFIPYGFPLIEDITSEKQTEILKEYNLESKKYFLQITRFEPDNLPLEVLKGFQNSELAQKGYEFVLVGYKDPTPYASEIKALHGKNGIKIFNAIYDKHILNALRQNCICYLHGNSVGGTNPALLEAMANSERILAIDGPFSREVLGETGSYFTVNNLSNDFNQVLSEPSKRNELKKRVQEKYDWDDVAESYFNLTNNKPAAYQLKSDDF
jgi:glycosyltransferase involved in cell wall biosynthesis